MTDEYTEEQAIHALERLAKKWPSNLWLFSNGCNLYVMRTKPNGDRAMFPSGGVDPSYIVTTVDIPSDGGDW